jgi:hypothetical protein
VQGWQPHGVLIPLHHFSDSRQTLHIRDLTNYFFSTGRAKVETRYMQNGTQVPGTSPDGDNGENGASHLFSFYISPFVQPTPE